MSPTMIPCLIAIAALLLAPPVAAQQRDPPAKQDPAPDPRNELKQRMKDRYVTLETSRDAGKIGETFAGLAEVVKASDAQDKVDPKDPKSLTLGELVTAENKDRQRLYDLLAKDLKLTAEEVGKQNGIRILQKADDDHWFKVADGRWVQCKTVRKEEKKPPSEPPPPPVRR